MPARRPADSTIDVNARTPRGNDALIEPTPTTAAPKPPAEDLIAAVSAGDVEAVRQLVSNGVDVNAHVRYEESDDTALIRAIWKHDHNVIDELLKLGADPDRGSRNNYPIILATNLGYQSIVEQLRDAGADVNLVDREHAETPLIMASRQGHLATVKYLVEHGANVNQGVVCDWEEGRWRSPLNQATDPAVRAYLISQGAVAERQ
jgi:ankyrin repeat protein